MKYLLIFFGIFFWFTGKTQTVNPQLLSKPWEAFWIASTKTFQQDYGLYQFRKQVSLPEKPSSFVIHVSGDNRYKLYVNGQLASLGPARSEVFNWNFETIDIAPLLVAGNNIVAAVVWNFGPLKPWAQMSYRTAFILQGNSITEKMLNTDSSWKCIESTAYTACTKNTNYSNTFTGPGEQVDFNQFAKGWETNEFDDTNWSSAAELFNGLPKGAFAWTDGWMLVQSSLPQMEMQVQRLASLRGSSGLTIPAIFPKSKSSFTIPKKTKASFLLDQGVLTNAYFSVAFSKGKGSTIEIGYAETLFTADSSNGKVKYSKSNRNEIEGKVFFGTMDALIADGTSGQVFTSLLWRTYRYVQVTVETSNEALNIDDIFGVYTGYPFMMNAVLNTSDDTLLRIMETGWRTARLCAIETYMDCPYYEQLQYVGDTRIQAMVSLYNSGDDRLMKNAITQFDQSRMAEGITGSRFPTSLPQQIPTFSLWWISMVKDYWMYRDDTGFVKSFLPGIRQVLSFFSKYEQKDGRIKNAPYWEFTDWADAPGWHIGIAPVGNDGCSAILDLQLLLAYQTAALLETSLGKKWIANEYNLKAATLRNAILKNYWNENRKLIADTKEHDLYSQHANALAILTEVISGKEATALGNKILHEKVLVEATIYFKYYVNWALRKAGLGNNYLNQLQIWKDNLNQGLSTWAEVSDISNTRSDCHAWGASPNIEFFRTVLGIDTDAPGFAAIKVQPHLGNLKIIGGEIPHPKGKIKASYNYENGKWKIDIEIPANTTGKMLWKSKSFILKSGKNSFIF